MISIAIVKANGEMVYPAMMPTSSGCQVVVKPDVVRQNYRSWGQIHETFLRRNFFLTAIFFLFFNLRKKLRIFCIPKKNS